MSRSLAGLFSLVIDFTLVTGGLDFLPWIFLPCVGFICDIFDLFVTEILHENLLDFHGLYVATVLRYRGLERTGQSGPKKLSGSFPRAFYLPLWAPENVAKTRTRNLFIF